MAEKLWSQNALSTEFQLDRRTVAKRLRGVPPAGKVKGGFDGWRLADVVQPLLGGRGRGSSGPVPEELAALGAPFTIGQNPINEAMALTVLAFAESIPAKVAALAVDAGAPMAVAFMLYNEVAVATCFAADEWADQVGMEWRRPDHFNFPDTPDWPALAKQAGEPFDLEAWKRHQADIASGPRSVAKRPARK